MSNDFDDFGAGRTRLKRAFAEGSKAVALPETASRNTGPLGWCPPCVDANHEHCEGLAHDGPDDHLGHRCRCPVCKDKRFLHCFHHGLIAGIAGRSREGHNTVRCPECLKRGRITEEITRWSRSN